MRYKLVGGFSFYNRAEVKDALAYVRLAMHPEDDISLLRVLNVPPRGIGKTTVDALRETARADGIFSLGRHREIRFRRSRRPRRDAAARRFRK